ncbi:hypothetical protein GGH94_002960 [Coemansia aciculifera]|uniref:Uncharacterized protein n=1 Tax=Coemansia aciculifera TaxID=417176 RepID=A0A9W8IS17_9FUNG|nr:hypothetical protein GGH94_002960 [Coemansia aciculifera]
MRFAYGLLGLNAQSIPQEPQPPQRTASAERQQTQMTAGARETSNFHVNAQYQEEEYSQRLASLSPSAVRHHGVVAEDQEITHEECSERIDRLIQRVQQTHREYTAWQALGSPETPTPTRFDAQMSMGTVSTVSLASSSRSDAGEDGDMYGQRATMDAPKPEGMRSGTRSSATDVRQKLDRLRAKRRAEQSQGAARHNMGGDFFENSYNVSMFQELSAPVKELEWDKRVYYYHLAQNNDAYRRIAEDVDVRDCRNECLAELGGSRRRRDEIDAVSAWLEDPDDGEDIGERSFDWSRDGFGYMEFRRLSRASIGPSVLSPGGLATRTPLSLLDPNGPVTPRAVAEATPSPQRAMFPPPANSAGRLGSLRRISLGQRAAPRPVSMHTDFKQPLSRISEGGPDDGNDDGEWMAVDHESVDDTPAAKAQLRDVARENRQLQEEIKMACNAIDALTRLVLESA